MNANNKVTNATNAFSANENENISILCTLTENEMGEKRGKDSTTFTKRDAHTRAEHRRISITTEFERMYYVRLQAICLPAHTPMLRVSRRRRRQRPQQKYTQHSVSNESNARCVSFSPPCDFAVDMRTEPFIA